MSFTWKEEQRNRSRVGKTDPSVSHTKVIYAEYFSEIDASPLIQGTSSYSCSWLLWSASRWKNTGESAHAFGQFRMLDTFPGVLSMLKTRANNVLSSILAIHREDLQNFVTMPLLLMILPLILRLAPHPVRFENLAQKKKNCILASLVECNRYSVDVSLRDLKEQRSLLAMRHWCCNALSHLKSLVLFLIYAYRYFSTIDKFKRILENQ